MRSDFILSVAKYKEFGYTEIDYEIWRESMKTHDFYYDLPEELIAQTPLEKRDTSRLMVLDKVTGQVTHKYFYDILDYL